jgi:hypothetical protein
MAEPTNTDAELNAMLIQFLADVADGATDTSPLDKARAAILAYTHRYHVAGLRELAFKRSLMSDMPNRDQVTEEYLTAAIEAEEKKFGE